MKVLHISTSDADGGAALGSLNLHRAMLNQGIDSHLWVRKKLTGYQNVRLLNNPIRKVAAAMVKGIINSPPIGGMGYLSLNLVHSNLAAEINSNGFDVVNLHWIGGECMTPKDISSINAPIAWTLRDMWPFSGLDHYCSDSEIITTRSFNTNPASFVESLNRLAFRRKLNHLKNNIGVISLSSWLKECSDSSIIFKNNPSIVIPNLIATETFKPHNKEKSRQELGLPLDKFILVFGAIGGQKDPRKGGRLIDEAISLLPEHLKRRCFIVSFGEKGPSTLARSNGKSFGFIQDPERLAKLYSAADLTLVPSFQEAFGKTAAEPISCGCPVVAFACTGLLDVVSHFETGFLATPYKAESIASGIEWIDQQTNLGYNFNEACRKRALSLWNEELVVSKYIEFYKLLESKRSQ